MKRYCLDTSGISNPLETTPEDIHGNIWRQVREFVESGQIAVTTEIYEELARLPGEIGECIRLNKPKLVLEIGDGPWDWRAYRDHLAALVTVHRPYISEYNGNNKDTVCMNDISIIALAKALDIPLVSMERAVLAPGNVSKTKRRIPDICAAESVTHLTFNEFLRIEKISS
jgi:hypothetical protein